MSCSLPVDTKFFAMERRPLDHKCPGTPWQLPVEDFERIDDESGFVLGICCVKVGWAMIVVVHVNDDTKKLANARHEPSP